MKYTIWAKKYRNWELNTKTNNILKKLFGNKNKPTYKDIMNFEEEIFEHFKNPESHLYCNDIELGKILTLWGMARLILEEAAEYCPNAKLSGSPTQSMIFLNILNIIPVVEFLHPHANRIIKDIHKNEKIRKINSLFQSKIFCEIERNLRNAIAHMKIDIIPPDRIKYYSKNHWREIKINEFNVLYQCLWHYCISVFTKYYDGINSRNYY